jgi:hypothetical protein
VSFTPFFLKLQASEPNLIILDATSPLFQVKACLASLLSPSVPQLISLEFLFFIYFKIKLFLNTIDTKLF